MGISAVLRALSVFRLPAHSYPMTSDPFSSDLPGFGGFVRRKATPRSTGHADGLTLGAFELACVKRLTFREARQQLKASEADRAAGANARDARDRDSAVKRTLAAALNSIKPTLSPGAKF